MSTNYIYLPPFTKGHSLKKSFRHAKAKLEKKLQHLKSQGKLKKEPIKNSLGKGKSLLDFDLENFDSDRNFRDESRDLLSYYEAENGLEKMHMAPVHEGRAVSVQEPHLRYNFKYGVGAVNHGPRQSYAGEMIDEENTLSKFIAPPVFENRLDKLHQQENTRILYGTPQAQTAENANTKSFLNSLSSLMSPLSMSNFDQKELNDIESTFERGKGGANEKSNIEYEGKYKVVNDEVERESDEYNHGNEDEGYSVDKDESKFVTDHGGFDDGDRDGFFREPINNHDHFESPDRGESNRHNPYNEASDEYHSRNFDGEDNQVHEERNQNHMVDARSPENHRALRYDGYHQQTYDRNQRYDRNGKDEEDRGDMGGGKPIEVVQDDSGKLHPMSNDISKEELNNEVNKYVGHIPRN